MLNCKFRKIFLIIDVNAEILLELIKLVVGGCLKVTRSLAVKVASSLLLQYKKKAALLLLF
jgi:hypothetical protein